MLICIVTVSVHVSKLSYLINNLKTLVNGNAISAISHAIFCAHLLNSGPNSPLAACRVLSSLLEATNFT